jgi:hypothetical protein
MNVLIGNFKGDPEEVYDFVTEEVKRWELPEVTFGWGEEVESKKLFRAGEKARSLRIGYRGSRFDVLCLQVGRGFLVSLRQTIKDERDKAGFIHEITVGCFEEIVRRATRKALKRHLEAEKTEVPEGLDPAEVFY